MIGTFNRIADWSSFFEILTGSTWPLLIMSNNCSLSLNNKFFIIVFQSLGVLLHEHKRTIFSGRYFVINPFQHCTVIYSSGDQKEKLVPGESRKNGLSGRFKASSWWDVLSFDILLISYPCCYYILTLEGNSNPNSKASKGEKATYFRVFMFEILLQSR